MNQYLPAEVHSINILKGTLSYNQSISLIEKLLSKKGKPMMARAGFIYIQERIATIKLIFHSQNRSCNGNQMIARLDLIKMNISLIKLNITEIYPDSFLSQLTTDNHAPNPDHIPAIKLYNEVKQRAATTDESPSAIHHSALRTFPRRAAGELPRADVIVQTIRRQLAAAPGI